MWPLYPGKDFTVPVKRKQQQLKKYASRHSLDVQTWTEANDEGEVRLCFRFSPLEPTPAATPGRGVGRRVSDALAATAEFSTVFGTPRPSRVGAT